MECGGRNSKIRLGLGLKTGRLPMEEGLGEVIRSVVGGTVVFGNIRIEKGQHALLLRRERCR